MDSPLASPGRLSSSPGRFLRAMPRLGSALDPERTAARRVGILALVVAIVLALNLLLYTVMPLLGGPTWGEALGAIDALIGVILFLSLVLFATARWGRLSPRHLLDLGLVYVVVVSAIRSIGMALVTEGAMMPSHGLPYSVISLLIFPVVIPNAPWKILTTALIVATLDPVGAWLATDVVATAADAEGCATCVPFSAILEAYHWNYIAVMLAMVPSHVVRRLSRDVAEAQELGAYRLEGRLGAGGMGEVFRARHQLLARDSAIKLIRPERLGGDDTATTVARFEREARATANLHSPHTIDVYDFGVSPDGTLYYVMELLDGFDLDTLVRQFGPQPAGRVVHLLEQMCDSLDDAHRSHFVHRDVKPANVFVCRYGTRLDHVKVLDFGLVKMAGSDGDPTLTAQGAHVPGTPAFMAPETVTRGVSDARSDLYAVGGLAYWLLTGTLPFEGTTPMEVLAAHVHQEPDPPSRRTELEVPGDLEAIVLACLAKDPDRRPASARELRRRLRGCGCAGTWEETEATGWWERHAPPGQSSV